MGYDKVKWGLSITNTREAYNFVDEVLLYQSSDEKLEVELINERAGGQAPGMTQQERDVNMVYYTWKRYRDAYRASQLGL